MALRGYDENLHRAAIFDAAVTPRVVWAYRCRFLTYRAAAHVADVFLRRCAELATRSTTCPLIEKLQTPFNVPTAECTSLKDVVTAALLITSTETEATSVAVAISTIQKTLSVSVAAVTSGASSASAQNPNTSPIALTVESARYRRRGDITLFDLPLLVFVHNVERRLFAAVVDCRRQGFLDQDPTDAHAAEILLSLKHKVYSYDADVALLAERLHKREIVLHDYTFIFQSLRFELQRGLYFDVGHNILLRNAALRAGGKCWSRARNLCVRLELLRRSLLKSELPKDVEQLGPGI